MKSCFGFMFWGVLLVALDFKFKGFEPLPNFVGGIGLRSGGDRDRRARADDRQSDRGLCDRLAAGRHLHGFARTSLARWRGSSTS